LFGKDIYWYGVQALSLLEKGELHSPDTSPVFHLLAFIFYFTGPTENGLLVFQIVTSIWLYFTLSLAKLLLYPGQTRNFFVFPSLILLVLSFSYPKQSWALGFLVLSIGCYANEKSILRVLIAFLLFLFAFWFHRFVGLFGVGLFFIYLMPKRFYPWLFAISILVPFILAKDPDTRFYSGSLSFPLIEAFKLAGLAILFDWIFLFLRSENSMKMRQAIQFLGLVLLLPLFHFADVQYRILLSLLALGGVWIKVNIRNTAIFIISSLLWCFIIEAKPESFRYSYEDMLNPAIKTSEKNEIGLLVAHHGFCEYYHFHFNKECLSWKPDDLAIGELPKGKQIFRLVSGFRYENLKNTRNEKNEAMFSTHENLGKYLLVREDDWNQYLIWLEKHNSKKLGYAKSWKNPYRLRPDFLREKHTK